MDKDILGMQCRAARALLDITQGDLATLAGVSKRTIVAFEAEKGAPTRVNMRRIRAALEAAGAEFINDDQPGVRLRRGMFVFDASEAGGLGTFVPVRKSGSEARVFASP